MDFEPMCPGFESRESHDVFFFYFFFYLFFYLFIYLFIYFFIIYLFIYLFFFLCFFFFFFGHNYYSANLQIQHYCLYSVSPTLLLLMMPRPPAL